MAASRRAVCAKWVYRIVFVTLLVVACLRLNTRRKISRPTKATSAAVPMLFSKGSMLDTEMQDKPTSPPLFAISTREPPPRSNRIPPSVVQRFSTPTALLVIILDEPTALASLLRSRPHKTCDFLFEALAVGGFTHIVISGAPRSAQSLSSVLDDVVSDSETPTLLIRSSVDNMVMLASKAELMHLFNNNRKKEQIIRCATGEKRGFFILGSKKSVFDSLASEEPTSSNMCSVIHSSVTGDETDVRRFSGRDWETNVFTSTYIRNKVNLPLFSTLPSSCHASDYGGGKSFVCTDFGRLNSDKHGFLLSLTDATGARFYDNLVCASPFVVALSSVVKRSQRRSLGKFLVIFPSTANRSELVSFESICGGRPGSATSTLTNCKALSEMAAENKIRNKNWLLQD
eukprot:PhM_4_TR17857/c0_g1_i1/m.14108